MTTRLSVLIPLFRSARWERVIRANIAKARAQGAEVILSDRHGHDDLAARIAGDFSTDPGLTVLQSDDRAGFVENSNALLKAANGRFARIVPHDDDMLACEPFVEALERMPRAIMTYGYVFRMDGDGQRTQRRDNLQVFETRAEDIWSLNDALSVFWTSRLLGGFKGVVDMDKIRAKGLYLRKAEGEAYSERCWIAGLGMAGQLVCVDAPMLAKRFYSDSTHPAWRMDQTTVEACTRVLLDYADALISDETLRLAAVRDIHFNALRWYRLGCPQTGISSYRPAPVSSEVRHRMTRAL